MKNSINLDDAFRFLRTLDNDGKFTFLTFDDKKEAKVPVRMLHGTLEEHACQSALKIDPPSASKIDPPQTVVFSF